MEQKNLSAIVESILFVYGEPLGIKRLAAIAQASEEEIRLALGELAKNLGGRGLILLEKDNAWQLGTDPAAAPYIEQLARDQFGEELSRAALETLAIIAYKGPLGRSDIEYIRGVNSSFTLRALTMRGLVERTENPKDSRGFLYGVSMDFLKHLGLSRMEDLPHYEELSRVALPEDSASVAGGEMRGVPAKRDARSADAPAE